MVASIPERNKNENDQWSKQLPELEEDLEQYDIFATNRLSMKNEKSTCLIIVMLNNRSKKGLFFEKSTGRKQKKIRISETNIQLTYCKNYYKLAFTINKFYLKNTKNSQFPQKLKTHSNF